MSDRTYAKTRYAPCEIAHMYGGNVHLLDDPLSLTLLAHLSSPEPKLPVVLDLLRKLYHTLAQVVIAAEFPRGRIEVETRMLKSNPRAVWSGFGVRRDTKVVTAGVARAGTVPSQICFELLNEVLDPALVRQDHLFVSRRVDETGRVTGAGFADAKIGGDVDGRILLVPDPMGATGGSLAAAIDIYKKDFGRAAKYVTANLIVTPEYLRRMHGSHPDVIVYAVRLDRGASSEEVLAELPGARWDEESGLTERQYIVPGGGGFGEIMNNAYV